MKKAFKGFLVLVIISLFISTIVETASAEIILYGRKTCGFCTQMMKNLDEEKIPYTFKDIDDTKNHDEVSEKLQKAGITGRFRLPLMDINGTIKASPSFEEVKRILKDTR